MSLKNYDVTRMFEKTVEHSGFPFKDETGESTVWISKEKLEGKEPDEVQKDVMRSYDTFRRAEEWARSQDFTFTDEKALEKITDFYELVFPIVVANCCRVYLERLEEDTDEARAEREYLEKIPGDYKYEITAEVVVARGNAYAERYVKKGGPEYAQKTVTELYVHVTKHIAATAIQKADTEVPEDAPEEAWHDAFERYCKEGYEATEFLFSGYAQREAHYLLESELKPVEMPFQALREWAGITWFEKMLEGSSSPETRPGELVPPERLLFIFSHMPAQAVDRAARGASLWSFPLNDAPTFRDDNSKHAVTYFADGLSLEALREGVMELNPRTADIWRLCTAAILEAWGEGEREPPRVWVDARQLCDAMGFRKHHKGGHDPRNIAIAARALIDLERFYITIPFGAKQYPENAKTGKRRATTVEARAQHRVMAVMAKEEARQLFDEEWLPLRWLITAGEWVKAYPREQFAPLFRALVELPCTYTPDLWAKAIGTELVWQYRQNGGETKVQYVKTMLKQAGVLEEASQEKKKGRVRDNFEKALDKLQESNVCKGWEYNVADIDKVEDTTRGWFDLWLDCRVIVTPPQEITKALAATKKRKAQHRRKR